MQQGRKKQNFFPTLFNFSPQNFRPLITPIFYLMIFIKLLNTVLFHDLSPRKKKCVEVIQNYPEKTD